MANFVYYSDLQIHPWQADNNPEFWKLGFECIRKVYDIADRVGADAVIFGGDLFESKRTLRSDIVTRTYAYFHKMISKRKEMQHIFIAGNHDYFNGACTLQPIKKAHKNVVCAIKPQIITLGDLEILLVPHDLHANNDWYTRDAPDVMISHVPMEGAQVRKSVFDQTRANEYVDYQARQVRLSLCGHYHMPQRLPNNTYVVGAPMYFNWSDVDEPAGRGCMHVRMTKKYGPNITLHDFRMPRFVSTPDKVTGKNDIVRYPDGKPVQKVETHVHENAHEIAFASIEDSLRLYFEACPPGNISDDEMEDVVKLGVEVYANAR